MKRCYNFLHEKKSITSLSVSELPFQMCVGCPGIFSRIVQLERMGAHPIFELNPNKRIFIVNKENLVMSNMSKMPNLKQSLSILFTPRTNQLTSRPRVMY